LIQRFQAELVKPQPVKAEFHIDARRMSANFNRSDYHNAAQRIIDYIAAGDVYQVNMSQCFQAPFQGDTYSLFRHLLDLNPAPFFAYIRGVDHDIVSTSPERFVCRQGRRIEARPIKGTRPRCSDPDEDAAMRRELASSAKDEAELSMIVDLLRNDLGKVCRAGSVKVAEHKRLEAYSNVYHLVSIVAGELDPDTTAADVIRAAFPGGSITGCPKVRAMEIIDELETCRRHIYCGSIGYISFHDTMDLSIAIRTATITGDTLRFSVGGAVVFDSQPADEYQETLDKGRTLMAACRDCGRDTEPKSMAWFNGAVMPASAARFSSNDLGLLYGFGFFETIRVNKGQAPLLEAHLARFRDTWQALMPNESPDLSWERIIDQVIQANGLQNNRAAVKLLATRGSRNTPPWDQSLMVTARPYTHRLRGKSQPGLQLGTYPHPRQSPLANHKTLNYLYYYLAGQWAVAAGFEEALILNPDGSVSETNTGNLILINGRAVIKPASPAVLPGVMTGAVCHRLSQWGYQVSEQPVESIQLLTSDQVLVTNALMGCVPLLGVDGQDRSGGDELWMRLNEAILNDRRADF
jgi:para-aminobenzoate synthetase component 1